MALTTVTVTETFEPESPGGPVPSGYVQFQLSERIHDGSGNEVEPEPITADLGHAYTITQASGSAGTFTLTWNGLTTATIAYNAAASAVLSALNALSGFSALGASASGGALGTNPVVVTVPGDPSTIALGTNSVTGGTVTITEAASISQALYANDDTTTVPTGSYYTATFFLTGIAARNPVEIIVPHTAPSGTCTLASLS